MRLLNVVIKCFREQKRDLWMLGLSLAFAPLFVVIYYLVTGGTGSTAYSVLVINRDRPARLASGASLAAGEEIVKGLRGLSYKNGSPLLKVTLSADQAQAERQVRDRQAAVLLLIPPDFSAALAAYQAGDRSAATQVTLAGDLTNPYYTIAAVMVMTVADAYVSDATHAPRPVTLNEVALGASDSRSEFENYIPGLLVMAVVLLVFQAAMMPARDIESGALLRLRLTPLSAFEYLGGLAIWMTLVAVLSILVTFATAVACGFRSQGPLGLAILIDIIAALSVIAIGLIVACLSKTVSHAFVIANFPLGFLMFLTGAAFPLPRPTLLTLFGHPFSYADFLPPTHAVIALNKIFTLGAGFGEVAFEVSLLVILTILYFSIAVWLFRRTQMER
ncbi:MAG: ABC transporter permease [Anaerolineales bacterium]|nr:ABC transporter permease [Anaerolineales bacterium]